MDSILLVIIVGVVILVVLGKILLALSHSDSTKESDGFYFTKKDLFSNAEKSFFHVLQSAVKGDRLVLAKVRIADVVNPKKGLDRSNWQKHFNKISKKHFDYVLCHPLSLEVDCVIELDDVSHNSKSRVIRDEFVDSICSSASIAIHHFKAKKGYSIADVRSIVLGVGGMAPRPEVKPVDQIEELTEG